ncbi:MAG: hypothetical protein A2Z06_01350 [Candidatus Glassbacteria bacterium RBG_16_58_8]|uniref:Integrase n=1 Tax=Candidatus Glassbacteria bacterium RBG_16_58_8 TaxID=1817866 RepID=A0A1F5YBW4_9BACT|nr:MAG: hypothetical protein A2Z06_01350 [Candidatus Glassbacteria bacterium RBG_16_58_8]
MALVPVSDVAVSLDLRERISSLLADFLSRRSDRTRAAYDADLRNFASFLKGSSPLEAVSLLLSHGPGEGNGLALRYRNEMISAGLSAATANRRLSSLRSVVKLARTIGLVSWGLEIEGEKAEAYRDTRGPGRGELLRILAGLQEDLSPKGRRDLAIFRLLLDLGLRRGEIASLDLEDVDLAGERILVLGKGRTAKEPMTLPQETARALEAWISARGPDPGPLFLNYDRARKGDGRLTGAALYYLAKEWGARRPHGIRHAAITEVLNLTGGDVRKAARFSRHRDIRTLARYDDNRSDLGGEAARLLASSFPG